MIIISYNNCENTVCVFGCVNSRLRWKVCKQKRHPSTSSFFPRGSHTGFVDLCTSKNTTSMKRFHRNRLLFSGTLFVQLANQIRCSGIPWRKIRCHRKGWMVRSLRLTEENCLNRRKSGSISGI